MSAIDAKNLEVVKSKQTILRNLSFTVEKGTITGLMGPSGSGKTTLMRAIVGVQKISDGSVTVFGQSAGSKILRSGIGYVSQDPAVYGDLTVQQNLDYFATIAQTKKPEVLRILQLVELQEYAKRPVQSLSGGQRARVSLAIALLGDPELLVLDEPTVGLDPLLRKKLWALFREFANDGKTLLVSSHVMDEADHCDDILLMREGELLWQDSREKLLKNTGTKTIEAAFLRKVGTKR